ncbi:MAG: tetratricopeptide repeat protein, partial [Opitutales bacterium]
MRFVRIHCFVIATIMAFACAMVVAYGVTGVQLADAFEPELRKSAAGGDAYAQAVLALAYANGDKGLPLSISEAEKWARLSAAQGHPIGKFAMGYLAQSPILGLDATVPGRYYLSAFGDSKGDLVKMAASGDPIASYAIGMILTSDNLRPRLVPDMELAARHHVVASRADFLPSVLQLAIMRIEGMLVEQDVKGGLDLLDRAVSGNLPVAHHYMGSVYFNGKVMPENRGMALVHFRKAADLGHGESMLLTAEFYAHGMATPIDLPLARQYALRAASLKEPKAEAKLLEIESLAVAGSSPTPLHSRVPEPEETDLPPAPPSPVEVSSSSPPIPPPLPSTPGPTTIPFNPSVIPEAPSPEQSS